MADLERVKKQLHKELTKFATMRINQILGVYELTEEQTKELEELKSKVVGFELENWVKQVLDTPIVDSEDTSLEDDPIDLLVKERDKLREELEKLKASLRRLSSN